MLGSLDRRFRPYAQFLLETAAANGIGVRVTSTRRSRRKQAELYRRYLRGEMPYIVLPPGRSLHEQGLAIDLVTIPESAVAALGAWWRSIGGRWGGQADPVHFSA